MGKLKIETAYKSIIIIVLVSSMALTVILDGVHVRLVSAQEMPSMHATNLTLYASNLTVYANGPYEVWGGYEECPNINCDPCSATIGYSDPARFGYVFLGQASSTSSFVGNYRYYVVGTTSQFELDAIQLPDGNFISEDSWLAYGNLHRPFRFYPNGTLIGNSNDYYYPYGPGHAPYIYGPPDGLTDEVGLPPGWEVCCPVPFQGCVAVRYQPPVLLVYGWHGSEANWDFIKPWLEADGYRVEIFNATDGFDDTKSAEFNAACLVQKVNKMRDPNNDGIIENPKVDIIAHGFGGLVSRCYIEDKVLDGARYVRNLIMIATPNHGSRLADYLTGELNDAYGQNIVQIMVQLYAMVARADSTWGSSLNLRTINNDFLNNLNSGFDASKIQTKYFTLAGTGHYPIPVSSHKMFLEGPDDGVVRVGSVTLPGVPLYCVELDHSSIVNPNSDSYRVIAPKISDGQYECPLCGSVFASKQEYNAHSLEEQRLSKIGLLRYTYQTLILAILEGNPPSTLQFPTPNSDAADNQLPLDVASWVSVRIHVGESATGYFDSISRGSRIEVIFTHPFSDFEFTLTSPSGKIITPQVAEADLGVNFVQEEHCLSYIVDDAEVGTWQYNITALDVPADGEDIGIFVLGVPLEESAPYLVVCGLDDRIYHCIYNSSSNSWSSWNVLPTGATCDSPATALIGNELHFIVRGLDEYSLWHGYLTNPADPESFSGWTQLSGATNSAPTLASNGTTLCLVVRGLDNRVYYRCYSEGDWGQWYAVPTGATPDAPAASMLGNDLHIVVRGMDGNSLWDTIVRCDGTVVRSWGLLSGATPSKPVLACSGLDNLCLVVRGMDNAIYYRSYTGSTDSWGGWSAVPTGATIDGPAATVMGNELCVVVRGSEGNTLWCGDVDLGTSSFTGWTLLTGATPSAPTLTG